MINIIFTYCAMPPPSKGALTPVHCYICTGEPTRTDNPDDERRVARIATKVADGLSQPEADEAAEDRRLIQHGEMPPEAMPIFAFGIAAAYDRPNHMGRFRAIDYRTVADVPGCGRVSSTGAEIMRDVLAMLNEYEKRTEEARTENGLGVTPWRFDRISLAESRAAFEEFADTVYARQVRRLEEKRLAVKRAACPNRCGEFCSPADPKCPCYKDGRCAEPKGGAL